MLGSDANDGQHQRIAGEVVDTDSDTAQQWVAAGWAEKADKQVNGHPDRGAPHPRFPVPAGAGSR